MDKFGPFIRGMRAISTFLSEFADSAEYIGEEGLVARLHGIGISLDEPAAVASVLAKLAQPGWFDALFDFMRDILPEGRFDELFPAVGLPGLSSAAPISKK